MIVCIEKHVRIIGNKFSIKFWKIIGAYIVKRKAQLVDKYLEAKEMTFPDKFGSISQIAGTARTHHLRMGQSYKQTKDHRNLVRIPDIRQK